MRVKIIFEDEELIVCQKPSGIAVQNAVGFQADVVSELKNYLSTKTKEKTGVRCGEKEPYLGMIHRIDQPVEGLVVFACTKQAAAELSAQLSDGRLYKKYLAVLEGTPEKTEAVLRDYLKKENKTNLSRVVTEKERDAKYAELSYRILAQAPEKALAEVEIKTGRHHQIRVQMSHSGHPLFGDTKYGAKNRGQLALCAYYLEFIHPRNKKKLQFMIKPENAVFADFTNVLELM